MSTELFAQISSVNHGAVARAVAAHAASFADDLVAAGVPRAWTDALPAVALLHLVETVGVRCDGVATVVRAPALLPLFTQQAFLAPMEPKCFQIYNNLIFCFLSSSLLRRHFNERSLLVGFHTTYC